MMEAETFNGFVFAGLSAVALFGLALLLFCAIIVASRNDGP